MIDLVRSRPSCLYVSTFLIKKDGYTVITSICVSIGFDCNIDYSNI